MRAAMLAFVTARCAGNKGVELSQFMIDTAPKVNDEEQDESEMDRQMQKFVAMWESREKGR